MPTCQQLKQEENETDSQVENKYQKQLTTKESSENRLITKVSLNIRRY